MIATYLPLIAPMAVALVSALCWLAYRHPRSYDRIARAGTAAAFIASVAWGGFASGYSYGGRSALRHIADGQQASAFDTWPFSLWNPAILCLISLFLILLQGVHKLKDD